MNSPTKNPNDPALPGSFLSDTEHVLTRNHIQRKPTNDSPDTSGSARWTRIGPNRNGGKYTAAAAAYSRPGRIAEATTCRAVNYHIT